MPKLSELTERDSVVFKDDPKKAPKKLSELSSKDDVIFSDEPSKLESFGRGALGSATLGFNDEIGGVINAGMHLGSKFLPYESPYDDASQAYTVGRDEDRAKDDAAYKANPWSYRGGSFVGGALLPGASALKGATIIQGIGRGALAGAAAGGVSGLGESRIPLSDIGGNAAEIAKGAAIGGVVGGAVGGVANVAGRSLSKEGRQGLKDEVTAFRRGASKKDVEGISDIVPVVGPAARKTYEGVKETVTGAKAQSEFRVMVKAQKNRLAEKLADEGNDPIEVMKSLDAMPDDEFIIRSLLDDGDNEVKTWVAKSASGLPGQIGADEYQKILALGPETRNAARAFTANKREVAKEITPQVKEANFLMKGAVKDQVSKLTRRAEDNFSGDITDLLQKTTAALEDSTSMKTIPSTVSTRLSDIVDLVAEGKAPSHFGLTKDAKYFDVDPSEQFRRLQKMRETLDGGIDWDAIKTGKRSMDEGEQILAGLRGEVDKILKSTPGKIQADHVYKLGKEIRDAVFKKSEIKGGVDEFKIGRLLNDNDEGKRFRSALNSLEDWANDPQYAEEARTAAKGLVEKFRTIYKLSDDARALVSFKYKQGPSSPAVERLGSTMNKNTLVQDAIRSPSSFINSADEFVKNNAMDLAGKSYKDMSTAEKSALIKTWVKYKADADAGKFQTKEGMKELFDSFKDGKKGPSGTGGKLPINPLIPTVGLLAPKGEAEDRSSWVSIDDSANKRSLGAQLGSDIDETFFTDRIGNEDGTVDEGAYMSMPSPTGVGKASKKLLEAVKKAGAGETGLQKIFAAYSKMKAEGNALSDSEEKLFSMLEKKFKRPLKAIDKVESSEDYQRYLDNKKYEKIHEYLDLQKKKDALENGKPVSSTGMSNLKLVKNETNNYLKPKPDKEMATRQVETLLGDVPTKPKELGSWKVPVLKKDDKIGGKMDKINKNVIQPANHTLLTEDHFEDYAKRYKIPIVSHEKLDILPTEMTINPPSIDKYVYKSPKTGKDVYVLQKTSIVEPDGYGSEIWQFKDDFTIDDAKNFLSQIIEGRPQ